MDFTSLIPSLLRAGAPLIADLLTTAATVTLGPAGGAVVGTVTHAVAAALGVEPTPAAIDAAIQANPDHAASVLPQVEADHADLINGAIAQANFETERARLDEQNVENARDMELKLVQAGSWLQWAPVVVSALCIAGMGLISWAIITKVMPDGLTAGRVEGFWETVATAAIFYWIGNTRTATTRADQAISYAEKAAPPAAKRIGR